MGTVAGVRNPVCEHHLYRQLPSEERAWRDQPCYKPQKSVTSFKCLRCPRVEVET